MKTFNSPFLILFFSAIFCWSSTLAQEDFDVILERVFEEYQSQPSTSKLDEEAQNLTQSIQSTGSWNDINYNDQSGTGWQPDKHLKRIGQLTKAYTREGSRFFNSPEVFDQIESSLRYWVELSPAPKSSNWWWGSISVPKEIGNILTLLRLSGKDISEPLEASLLEWMTKTVSTDKSPGKDGSNLTDIAQHRIIRAALTKNEKLLSESVALTSKSIRFSEKDGIQIDNSFHAHGPELYIHGYGREYLSGIRNIQYFVQGTPYSYTSEQMKLIANFVTEGYLQVLRGRYVDYSVIGRGIARNNATRTNAGLVKQIQRILPKEDALKLNSAIKRLDRKENASFDIQAKNIHYWRSDYMVHHRPSFMASVNIASNRTIRTESGNGENLNGQFLTEGAMNIAVDGDEYFNIFPIWKWYMIPGTTTPANQKLRKRTNWVAEPGNVDFVGGVSDGINGVATYAMDAYRTQANKAWFFFDNRIICLGSSISADRPEPIFTTVNQSWLKGKVWKITQNNLSEIPEGNYDLESENQWIVHDAIAYYFPSDQNLKLSTKKQAGSWSEINSGSTSKKIEKNVFTLWIDHELNPKNSEYQYLIFPGVDGPDKIDFDDINYIQVLKNNQSIQAVWDKKNDLVGAVFYKSGKLIWEENQMTIDQPGLILLSKTATGKLAVSYSDPTQKLTGKVKGSIEINGKSRDLAFTLPEGMKAGSTVTMDLDF